MALLWHHKLLRENKNIRTALLQVPDAQRTVSPGPRATRRWKNALQGREKEILEKALPRDAGLGGRMQAGKGGYAEINERAPAGRHIKKNIAFNMFPYFTLSPARRAIPNRRGELEEPQAGEG